MGKSKNDIQWEKIFKEYKILENIKTNKSYEISSDVINKFREARLMTKFDHYSHLPEIFQQNKLSILPISRGNYIIGHFEIFFKLENENIDITKIKMPHLQSLDCKNITSEATTINCVFISSILNDFTGEKNLVPTVNGRMHSSSFTFQINAREKLFDIDVENSQIEIDGGYEGKDALILIEAKNHISDDFLVRQLYYPYRLWKSKIKKTVRNIFLTYTNGIFHLREYVFQDPEHYNSLYLAKQKKYTFQEQKITIEKIREIFNSVQIMEEPRIPFPQADSFDRIINLCELLAKKDFMSKEEITQNYDFNPRQADYYGNAGKYLGLISTDKKDGKTQYYLTQDGEKIFLRPIIDRQLHFIRMILSHSVFYQTLKLYFQKKEIPSGNEVVGIMKEANLYNIDSHSTYYRRAQTVLKWVSWMVDQIEN